MKCEKCGINEVTTHYTQNINGQVTELRLCGECAESAGLSFGGFSFSPFGSLSSFGSLGGTMPGFGSFGSLLGGLLSGEGSALPSAAETQRCTVCGRSFAEISKSGKLGCERCYTQFARQLRGSIARLHGSAVHAGKRPGGASPTLPPSVKKATESDCAASPAPQNNAGEIAALRDRLNRAVAAQEYEKCAEIRDEIKRLEGNA